MDTEQRVVRAICLNGLDDGMYCCGKCSSILTMARAAIAAMKPTQPEETIDGRPINRAGLLP